MADASVYIGADTAELDTILAQSSTKAEAGGNRIARGMERGAAGGERLLSSSHRVANQMSHVSKTMLSGASSADVFSASLEGLERSLHIPLGALAGLGIGAVIVEKLHEAYVEAKKLDDELFELTKPHASYQFESTSDIEERLKKTRDLVGKLKEQTSSWFTAPFKDVSTGIGKSLSKISSSDLLSPDATTLIKLAANFGVETAKSGDRRIKQIGEANIAEKDALIELSKKEKETADLSEKRLKIGELAAERAKIEAEYTEKIGEAKLPGPKQNKLRAEQLEREKTYALETIDKTEAAQHRAIDLENKILEIKKAAVNVDVLSSEAKLSAAKAALEEAPKEGRAKADNAVKAAELEVEEAKRLRAEKERQLEMESKIANLHGSDLEKRRQMLDIERETLEAGLANAVGDSKKPFEIALAKNRGQSAAQDMAEDRANIAEKTRRTKAGLGLGSNEELRGIEAEIEATKKLMDLNRQSLDYDSQYDAEQEERLHNLEKQKDELKFRSEIELAASKAQTQEMELRQNGDVKAARQVQIRAQFEAQIARAMREQNKELAKQLQKQEKIALREQEIDDYLKTPRQRQQEKAEQRKRDRAARIIDARHKSKEHAEEANRDTFSDWFGGTKTKVLDGTGLDHKAYKDGERPQESFSDRFGAAKGTLADFAKKQMGALNHPDAGNGAPEQTPTSPGATGAANDSMTIKQMTVSQMTVENAVFKNIEIKSE